jgi:hypothetical protein
MVIKIPSEMIGLAILKFDKPQFFKIIISLDTISLFNDKIKEIKNEIGKI